MKILFSLTAAFAMVCVALAAIVPALPAGAQSVEITPAPAQCVMSAVVLWAGSDATHVKFVLAVQSKCSDGQVKIYSSRQVVIDIADAKTGTILLRACAVEVAKQMQADGAKVTDQDILDHAQLVDTDAAPSPSATATPNPVDGLRTL